MVKSTETKRRTRRVILYEVLFIVLLAVAGIVFFVNHTLAVFSIPLLFLGLIFSALFLRLSLINHGSTHGVANRWMAVIIFPSAILCGCLFWIEFNETKDPRIIFALTTSHDTKSVLEITNCSLPPNGQSLLTETNSFLEIHTFKGETGVGLQFMIANDSKSSVQIENPEVFVVLPKAARFEMESGWIENVPGTGAGAASNMEFRQFSKKFHQTTILPGDSEHLPPIVISRSQPPDFGGLVPLLFDVRAHNVTQFRLGFWLIFVQTPDGDTNLYAPQVVSGQKVAKLPDGTLRIPISKNE